MHRTVGNELNKYAGVGPGFDLLRIVLALLIFHLHTQWIAQSTDPKTVTQIITGTGEVIWQGWTRPRFVALVPMFFALSGFLVTGSAFRTRSVRTFLTFRFLRIFPALATEVTLSALILGPFLTTMPLRQYFSDPHFWEYFGNIVGRIRFKLPGLFESNPVGGLVNLNLWTLTPEYDCYVLVTFAMLCSLFWARTLFTCAFALATAVLVVANTFLGTTITPTVFPGYVMVYHFFAGCLIYHWRNHIPFGLSWFVGSVILSYFLLLWPRAIFIAPLPLTYVTVCLGLVNFPRVPILQRGDYSYGVYLYGFPIAQGLMSIWPPFARHGSLLTFVGVATTLSLAVFSWHFVEKPFLSLKRFIAPKEQLVSHAHQAPVGIPMV